jgi:hypothetical protein
MGFEAIIAREVGRRRLERIPVAEIQPDHSINQRAETNLVTVPEGPVANGCPAIHRAQTALRDRWNRANSGRRGEGR